MNSSPPGTNESKQRALPPSAQWEIPLSGHGVAYFRELTVEFQTLQWVNPHATILAAAKKLAQEKKAESIHAEAVLQAAAAADKPAAEAKRNAAAKAVAAAEQAILQAEAEYEAAEVARDETKRIIEKLIAKFEEGHPVWNDVLVFESALLRLLPLEKLRAKHESLRREYQGLTGTAFPAVLAPTDAQAMPAAEKALRAEAENLLAEIHWHYTTEPVQETEKSKMVRALALITIAMAVFALALSFCPKFSLLAAVLFAGAAGAALSAFQRVQSRDVKGDALTNLAKHSSSGKWSFTLSIFAFAPVIGALSALVLAHVFAGNLIQGAIFPRITLAADGRWTNEIARVSTTNVISAATNTPGLTNVVSITNMTQLTRLVSITNMFAATNPPTTGADPAQWRDCHNFCAHRWCMASGTDLALLLVWAFVAGFSERLVPDMISRLAEKAKDKV